jgi:hypothetical protein
VLTAFKRAPQSPAVARDGKRTIFVYVVGRVKEGGAGRAEGESGGDATLGPPSAIPRSWLRRRAVDRSNVSTQRSVNAAAWVISS